MNITSVHYRTKVLQIFFEQLHDDEFAGGYFQWDNATPHCAGGGGIALIRELYGNFILISNAETPWSAHSSNLTTFFGCDLRSKITLTLSLLMIFTISGDA